MKVLVTIPMDKEQRERLQRAAGNAEIGYYKPAEVTQELASGAEVILGNVPAKRIGDSQKLQWMQLNSAGANAYLGEGKFPKQAVLTTSNGAYGLAVSEHMLAALLCLIKKLHLYRDHQRAGEWSDEGPVTSLSGATVLVLGLGDIGGEFAKKVRALGARVIGVRRADSRKPDYVDELYLMEDLDDLLPRADIVACFLPSTPATDGLFDTTRLKKLKNGAFFLNAGRGTVVDTEALCDAVESGALAGAGVDVTDPEPLPEGHRMWGIDNILITPHISGQYHLPQTLKNIVEIAIDNMGRFVRGERLRNVVDFTTGYRENIK